jgi:hypothetical protein
MKRTHAAILLLAVQLVLVLGVAAKYLYERATRPRVWVLAGVYDPSQPLRGRYLALQLIVDACSLPHDQSHLQPAFDAMNSSYKGPKLPGQWNWTVALKASNGKLIAVEDDNPRSPADAPRITSLDNLPCDRVRITPGVEYFIPDTAKSPLPLKPGQYLWVEVTVPAEGPPRPIQLAVSDEAGFHPLSLR